MAGPRFYAPQELSADTEMVLDKEASQHIARVLRMQVGDDLRLFNGDGSEAEALITDAGKRSVSVRITAISRPARESPLYSSLLVAVSRGERMDLVVQKATELGVSDIRPLISERTGVRLQGERLAKKREHWQRVAISACEQCGRTRIPEVYAPVDLADALAQSSAGGGEAPGATPGTAAASEAPLRLILQPGHAQKPLPARCESLCLLVGPEGGFSEAEVNAALDAGFSALSLGPRILRTETAPLAALAVLQARWGDLQL